MLEELENDSFAKGDSNNCNPSGCQDYLEGDGDDTLNNCEFKQEISETKDTATF